MRVIDHTIETGKLPLTLYVYGDSKNLIHIETERHVVEMFKLVAIANLSMNKIEIAECYMRQLREILDGHVVRSYIRPWKEYRPMMHHLRRITRKIMIDLVNDPDVALRVKWITTERHSIRVNYDC